MLAGGVVHTPRAFDQGCLEVVGYATRAGGVPGGGPLGVRGAPRLEARVGLGARLSLGRAALGAVGGPLAYLAGEKLGAITFNQPLFAIAALAVIWAVAMPLLVVLATRMDGMSEIRQPDFILTDWKESHHA